MFAMTEDSQEDVYDEEDPELFFYKTNKKHTTFEDTDHRPSEGNDEVTGESETETDFEPLTCLQYNGYEAIAKNFVEDILDQSVKAVSVKKTSDAEEEEESTSSSAITFVEFFGSFTSWPTIEEFTVELGEDRIGEYLSTWYYEEDWLYCVDLRLEQSDGCCDYYIYETKWSLPTKEYPIPQATASIYFTIAVSRVKPPQCTVDVSYNYEGCRYIHLPFQHTFSEHWLFNIIEAKLKFFKTLRF